MIYVILCLMTKLSSLQVFFVESVCDDPEVIAANILVGLDCRSLF